MTSASPSNTLFGPTVTVKIVVSGTDGATFVSETIPDNTVMTPGQSFTKTWTLKNTGTTTWTTGATGYTLNYQSGDHMTTTGYLTLASTVAPNGQTTFSVALTAPTTPGTYTGSWRMTSASPQMQATQSSRSASVGPRRMRRSVSILSLIHI